jgi:cellulose biosynthesis protein BcsQ
VVRAADLVIVPIPPSPLSSRAFEMVVEEVQAQGVGHLPILPVLSMLDMRRSLHKAAREANPRWPAIPQSSAIEQCAVRQLPVGAFASASPGAQAFKKLWTAIERKLAEK